MLILSKIWLKGLRTKSKARQQPYEVHTLKRQRESKLPRQTLLLAAYRVGRIKKLKISTHSCMLFKNAHAGSVLCTGTSHPSLPSSRHCCLLHSWALTARSTELWLLSPRAGVFSGKLT